MRRPTLTGIVLALALGCGQPTAPTRTGCTFRAFIPAKDGFPSFTIKTCYHTCAANADSVALAVNQVLVRSYQCAA